MSPFSTSAMAIPVATGSPSTGPKRDGPGPSLGIPRESRTAGTPQGTGRSGERRVQPFLTSISVLLKMLFPLAGLFVLPFSITPVRFAQIVLPAMANGPSLSTYTP
jgi:hypothetical protein